MASETSTSILTLSKRVLIVDAHPVVRAGVRAALDGCSRGEVCGEAANHHDTLHLSGELKPDLATLGLNVKDYHWLELLRDMRVQFPALPILVVSMEGEPLYAQKAIDAGARGYVTMLEPLAEVLRAIESVFSGEIYVSRLVTTQLAGQMAGRKRDGHVPSLRYLTERELKIFELTGDGFGARQIAAHLNLGKSTVETHRNRIKEKLCLPDNSELLQAAIRWKWSGNPARKSAGFNS
jgi:DNA-binding NarL/FixJ family response regulator